MAKKRKDGYLEQQDRVPPFVCRMMAMRLWHGCESKKVRRLTLKQLVTKSGIPARSFQRISGLHSWEGVGPELVDAFTLACGVNLMDKDPCKTFREKFCNAGLDCFTKAQRKFFDKVTGGK